MKMPKSKYRGCIYLHTEPQQQQQQQQLRRSQFVIFYAKIFGAVKCLKISSIGSLFYLLHIMSKEINRFVQFSKYVKCCREFCLRKN